MVLFSCCDLIIAFGAMNDTGTPIAKDRQLFIFEGYLAGVTEYEQCSTSLKRLI
jgi:hypothetical protein